MGSKIIKLFKQYKRIGVHVRLYDKCITSCNIDSNSIYVINNISKSICRNNFFTILSSFSKNFTKLFMSINKNSYVFNSDYNIKHSQKYFNFKQEDVDKIVLDIYLTSNSDYILLSGNSTFSLLILYKGYYENYRKCKSKYYKFWNNGELYDHLEYARITTNCKNVTV